jgi:hypothetical protein
MAAQQFINNSEAVSNYINEHPHDFAELINTIRQLILSSDSQIGEHIKWNSPSFFYDGPMEPFKPKEYKRDLVVVNTRKNIALLVFPTGDIIQKATAILEGTYTDGRRMITFNNMYDIKNKGIELQKVIKEWISLSKSES